MDRRVMIRVTLAMLMALVGSQAVHAQYTGNASRNIRNATRNFVYNRPTVSPYVNLATPNNSVGLSNYFTYVRPQLEQQEQAIAQQRQSAQMQQQLNQVQDQVRETQQQSASMMLTGRMGWSARGMPRFGTTMSYYPGFQRIPPPRQ